MTGRNLVVATLISVFLPAVAFSADPPTDDLLNRAIQDRGATATAPDPKAASELRTEADRLAAQRKFDEAIALYEKAYRLDPSNQDGYSKLLIAKKAAGRLSESEHEALTLLREARVLKIEEVIRGARLAIVQAREALRGGDAALAHERIKDGRAMLQRLPDDVDVVPYRTELDRLTLAARRIEKRNERAGEAPRLGDAGQVETDDAPVNDIEPSASFDPPPGAPRYEPDGKIIDPVKLTQDLEYDPFRRYQRDMDFAVRASRANWFLASDETGLLPGPRTDLAYPADWPERVARRAKYYGGEIYRGPTATGPDGQEYYTAIYDLGDLVHPVPNFNPYYDPFVGRQLEGQLDRDWIRRRSLMFGGYASDLAAGIPVLQYYGGMDNWAVAPRSDATELERVLRIIDAFQNGK